MPELASEKVISFPFYQKGNWGTRCIQTQETAERKILNLNSVSHIMTERLFFLLVMWLVTLLGTVWNHLSCFFSCLDCCKIGDIYPAVLPSQTPLLKEKTLMLFLFRSKPSNSKKCLFTPSKAFGRLCCSTQNTAIVPSICTVTNTENQQLW